MANYKPELYCTNFCYKIYYPTDQTFRLLITISPMPHNPHLHFQLFINIYIRKPNQWSELMLDEYEISKGIQIFHPDHGEDHHIFLPLNREITFLVTRIFMNHRWFIFSFCTAVYKGPNSAFQLFFNVRCRPFIPFLLVHPLFRHVNVINLIQSKTFQSACYLQSTIVGAEHPRFFMIWATSSRVHILLRKTSSFLFLI